VDRPGSRFDPAEWSVRNILLLMDVGSAQAEAKDEAGGDSHASNQAVDPTEENEGAREDDDGFAPAHVVVPGFNAMLKQLITDLKLDGARATVRAPDEPSLPPGSYGGGRFHWMLPHLSRCPRHCVADHGWPLTAALYRCPRQCAAGHGMATDPGMAADHGMASDHGMAADHDMASDWS
jgi:hypothetical protein